MRRECFGCWNRTFGDLRITETASEHTRGGKERDGVAVGNTPAASAAVAARRTNFKGPVRGAQIRKQRDRGQRRSLLMLDPLVLYIFAGCVVILALGIASGDFS
jgi:hypothetical protein